MATSGGFKENWLQPFLYLGRNRLSLLGGALTSASAFTLIGFWVVDMFGHGGSSNPYLGLLIDIFLPGLFVLGLLLIPLGIWLRRRHLRSQNQLPSIYPKIDLADPFFRRALEFVIIATFINFVIIGTASYRAVDYMDKPSFCGQSCHVMKPEWTAYQYSPHSHVACTDCHVGSGAESYLKAKVNGTKQLVEVVFNTYPHPVEAPVANLRPAREICEGCHDPAKYIGEKLLVKTSFGDDEKNSITRTVVLLHLGGRDSFSRLTGIHGVHLGHIEYIATDRQRQTIPFASRRNGDGTTTEFISSDQKGPVQGVKRLMDCIDCHNRAAHTFQPPETALNRTMTEGSPNASLPFVHKEGLVLLKASYASEEDAESRITSGLQDFYRSQYPAAWNQQRAQIDDAAKTLVTIYKQNVFPFMKVAWGTHPNNVGHTDYTGCFRCHDGNHNSVKDATKSITNDCSVCHNLLAVDETNPKQLADLGMQ